MCFILSLLSLFWPHSLPYKLFPGCLQPSVFSLSYSSRSSLQLALIGLIFNFALARKTYLLLFLINLIVLIVFQHVFSWINYFLMTCNNSGYYNGISSHHCSYPYLLPPNTAIYFKIIEHNYMLQKKKLSDQCSLIQSINYLK